MSKDDSTQTPWGNQSLSDQPSSASRRAPPQYLFPPGVETVEVKEFTWPDWIVTGTNGAQLALFRPRGTLYRAPHAGGGYDAYVAIDVRVWAKGWATYSNHVNPPGGVHLSIQLETATGAPLWRTDAWPIFSVACGEADASKFYQQAIDPDLFDATGRITLLSAGGKTWHRC